MAEAVSKACCNLWSVSLVLNVVGEGPQHLFTEMAALLLFTEALPPLPPPTG